MKTTGRCRVQHLLEAIERLKNAGCSQEEINDMPVYIQRIEDEYFETGGWRTNVRQWGFYPEDTTQYIEAFSPALVKDEEGNYEFCIDAHY